MSWIGGATAVLTLFFGVQRLVGWAGNWREQKQRVTEMLAVAVTQQQSQNYREAWGSLAEAEKLDSDNDELRRAQEDLAMEWLREARVRQGEQTFTELVRPLQAVLERGALRARGQRKADLLAHAGWADFLRWRDGAREFAVDTHYRRALEGDANNPFAHAMWGHWILFTRGAMDSARSHFAAAVTSGRERRFVRRIQLAALLNLSNDESLEEVLRVTNEMRINNEPLDEEYGRTIFWRTCVSAVRTARDWVHSATRIAAAGEIATLHWLHARTKPSEGHADMLDLCEARAHAWSGDTARAIAMLRRLELQADGDGIRAFAKQAADNLSLRPAQLQ